MSFPALPSLLFQRRLTELLDELRTAWTSEQNAFDLVRQVEPAAAALADIVAIQSERDTALPALRAAAHHARQEASQADTRLAHTTTVYEHVAGRIREAMLADWDAQRPGATAAAQTIEAGTGRFGQHRTRVTDARHQLAEWAQFWQPYLPALPNEPDRLVRYALSYDDRAAHSEAFDRYAHHRAGVLHPEHADAQTAAEHAHARIREADSTYLEAGRHYSQLLNRHGRLARDPDPAGTLHTLEQELTGLRRRADTARETITALEADPTLRSAPADTLTSERERWTHERRRAKDDADLAAALQATAAERAAHAHLGMRSGLDLPTPLAPQPHPLEPGPGLGL